MKIDLNRCIPFKETPEAMIRPNKYIPEKEEGDVDEATVDNEQDEQTVPETAEVLAEDLEKGRTLKYLSTILYTPVMTSKRVENHRHTISNDDIEELNHKLNDLFLHNGKKINNSEKNVQNESTDDEKKANESPMLGRVSQKMFSYKTCKSSQVVRSARIAAAK